MLPALPVNGKLDFLPIVVDGGDDILHLRSQRPLPEPHINVGGISGRFEILSQAGEIRHGGVIALKRPGFSGGSFHWAMQPYRGSRGLHSNCLRLQRAGCAR